MTAFLGGCLACRAAPRRAPSRWRSCSRRGSGWTAWARRTAPGCTLRCTMPMRRRHAHAVFQRPLASQQDKSARSDTTLHGAVPLAGSSGSVECLRFAVHACAIACCLQVSMHGPPGGREPRMAPALKQASLAAGPQAGLLLPAEPPGMKILRSLSAMKPPPGKREPGVAPPGAGEPPTAQPHPVLAGGRRRAAAHAARPVPAARQRGPGQRRAHVRARQRARHPEGEGSLCLGCRG